MIMRKFVVELHTDGSMTWAEYTEPNSKEDWDYLCAQEFEEPADQALTNYQAGFQDAVHEIQDSLESLKLSYINKVREYIQCGKTEDASRENGKALAMYVAIALLRRRYGVFGTRR